MNVQYKNKQGQLVWEKTGRIIMTLDDENGQQFNIIEWAGGLQVTAHPAISVERDSRSAVILKEWEGFNLSTERTGR